MFEEERFADFSVLWLLLHASRFGAVGADINECPLERWRDAAREAGTRARDQLRLGVEKSLLGLGQDLGESIAVRAGSLHDVEQHQFAAKVLQIMLPHVHIGQGKARSAAVGKRLAGSGKHAAQNQQAKLNRSTHKSHLITTKTATETGARVAGVSV
jgi:hypothetical protein